MAPMILPDWMVQFTLPLPIWLRWIAVGVATVTLALLIWAHHTLGKQSTVQIQAPAPRDPTTTKNDGSNFDARTS